MNTPGPDGFSSEVYKTFKGKKYKFMQTLSKNTKGEKTSHCL